MGNCSSLDLPLLFVLLYFYYVFSFPSANNVSGDEDGRTGVEDPRQLPYVRPTKKPAGLKLILDPRQIIDMRRLLEEGVDIVQHDAVSPEVCHNIVRDLNAQAGRGAQLFAKRKKKSEEWVVDDNKVRGASPKRRAERWRTNPILR